MSFSEEQVAFRDNIRKMVGRHVAPIAAEIDETDRFPLELVKLFGEMGLMQLWVPEQYGGPNGNLTLACIAREEISRVSPACASIAALNTMFIMPLLHFGSEEQRKKFLPIIAKGGIVTAYVLHRRLRFFCPMRRRASAHWTVRNRQPSACWDWKSANCGCSR